MEPCVSGLGILWTDPAFIFKGVSMKLSSLLSIALGFLVFSCDGTAQALNNEPQGRDPKQPIDEWYTQQIAKYTTAPEFNSPLTNYLPASGSVPTPAKVLGDVAGAPNMLPYAEDVYRYFRLLESSTPRVKVFTIGHTEEGREMIAAAIADEALLSQPKTNEARLAKLADPRLIGMSDTMAQSLVAQSSPVYYITGTIHSPETGAPTALMELAYRLAVDSSPYIQYIRSHVIVLITPVVEVDGRDRMVDVYRWHKTHPDQNYPRLVYWGHYVAHDNNRDAMGMTLNLTNNVLSTYLSWHAQVLHDLHESVPFLYDNTVGDGPYNAWLDPLIADEWAMLGWNNVAQMQSFGMPGVFTHGNFDTWSPGYLMFLAGLHNGISRLYETFGNGGADTVKRILTPDQYSRTWYRQNPPYPTVLWSQRNNNNYEETALLTTLNYFAHNAQHFLTNFYLKSKHAVEKPLREGPAAYVLPADPESENRQLALLRVLKLQHVEISRLDSSVSVPVPPPARPILSAEEQRSAKPAPTSQTFGPGSYVIRMDQPYSRVADALLDREFWSPDDPQKHPFDDTGWSFGDLFNVKAVRVTDRAILSAKMQKVAELSATPELAADTAMYAINNTGQISLAGLAYALKDSKIYITEQAFDSDGQHFNSGSMLIGDVHGDKLRNTLRTFDLAAVGLKSSPSVQTHAAGTPRIAFMHTWLYTQTEGWWRMAFDKLHVPYEYISTQTMNKEADLNSKYDVIIFAPVGGVRPEEIINGMPLFGKPIPWQKTELTPNLGGLDTTDDVRPGLGFTGVDHLKSFIEKGGLLIAAEDTAEFAVEEGLAPGVSVNPKKNARVVGSVLNAVFVDKTNPVSFGYGTDLPVYSQDGLSFNVSETTEPGRQPVTAKEYKRVTGRGGPEDEDVPTGRPTQNAPLLPSPKTWQPTPLNEDQARNNLFLIPRAARPCVVLRFGDARHLLLSGLLENPDPIAEHAVVVDARLGNGNVLLFGNNPVYRGETIGSYALVFNAILHFHCLNKQPH